MVVGGQPSHPLKKNVSKIVTKDFKTLFLKN